MNTFKAQSEIIDTKLKEISSLFYILESFDSYEDMHRTSTDAVKKMSMGVVKEDLLKIIKEMTSDVLKDIENRGKVTEDKSGDNKKSTRVHFYTTVDDEKLDGDSIDDLMKYAYGEEPKYNTTDFNYDAISDFIHRMNRLGHH